MKNKILISKKIKRQLTSFEWFWRMNYLFKKCYVDMYHNALSIVYQWVYQWIHHLGVGSTWNKEKVPRKKKVFKRDKWLRVELDAEILKKINKLA